MATAWCHSHQHRRHGVRAAVEPRRPHAVRGGHDNGLWIWDLADRSYPVRSAVLAAYPGRVNDVAFGPDDRSFSAAGPGKTIRTWIADVDDVTAAVCSNPASVITPEEWEQYFPGTSLSAPCPHQS